MKIHPPHGCVALLFINSEVSVFQKHDNATEAIKNAIQDHEGAEKVEPIYLPETFDFNMIRQDVHFRVWFSDDDKDYCDFTYDLEWATLHKEPEPSLDNVLETHYEVVAAIERIRQQDEDTWPDGIKFINSAYGTGGFYELAKDITLAFENKNADREWNGEFFDEIEAFINEYIQNLKH